MRLLMSMAVVSSMAFLVILRIDQPESGVIFGRITDETGSPISGARVAARHEARSLTFRASTDLAGNYRMGSLPKGRYSIFAEAPKHHTRILYGVIVHRDEEVHLDIALPCCIEEAAETAQQISRSGSSR